MPIYENSIKEKNIYLYQIYARKRITIINKKNKKITTTCYERTTN